VSNVKGLLVPMTTSPVWVLVWLVNVKLAPSLTICARSGGTATIVTAKTQNLPNRRGDKRHNPVGIATSALRFTRRQNNLLRSILVKTLFMGVRAVEFFLSTEVFKKAC